MSAEENRALIRRMFEESLNKSNPATTCIHLWAVPLAPFPRL
jgi:hypothetical protein